MRIPVTFAAAALLSIGAMAKAEEWPKWMGPRGDGISKETGLVEKWPAEGPKKLWTKPVGIGYCSPIGVDGKIYVTHLQGSKDVLSCFDAEKGDLLWEQSYDGGYKGAFPGTRATPTIADGKIYTYGGNGQLVCREQADGKQVWFLDVLKEVGGKNITWGLASSPMLYKDRVYVQAGQGGPMVIAADKATGKIVLKSDPGMCSYATLSVIDVAGTKQLIAFTGKAIVAMDPETLKTIWSYPWETKYDVNAMTPAYRDGHLFMSSNYDHGGVMLKVSADKAEKLWENKTVRAHFQPVILEGDVFYANDQGTLKCLAWPSGDVKWEVKKGEINLGNGGSLVRFGDKFIVQGESGQMSLVKATPEGCTVISKFQLFDSKPIWSTPLIYRGKLYAKGTKELVCMDISGK